MHPHVTKQLIAWFCSISLHLLHFHLMLDNYMQTQYNIVVFMSCMMQVNVYGLLYLRENVSMMYAGHKITQ